MKYIRKAHWTTAAAMIIIILVSAGTAAAQQIEATVSLMLERLPLEKQQKLQNFAENIEVYINDHDWTGEMLEEPIQATIQMYLFDNSKSYEDRYSGTFLISNNVDLQYYDQYWLFPYEPGDPLIHDDNNDDPFTGFIDFYIYLIIGAEYDKYGKMLGTRFYEKAKQISETAKFNTTFVIGWRERGDKIDAILSPENHLFREMKDLFFLGMSYVGEEDSTAQRYCSEALDLMENVLKKNPDHKEARQFLEAHHLDYINLFKNAENSNAVIRKLIYLDPDRKATYQKYLR